MDLIARLENMSREGGLIQEIEARLDRANSIEAVTIDDASPIETSFPGFATALASLGADIAAAR